MNPPTKSNMPPNPYKRSPIKKREDLAGRSREQKTIRYYLNLTSSGQNPHLALIGQRGVGKTSLLNGAEYIAKDFNLLPVRLNMNESLANSPGRFWRNLYQTLALSMTKAGCWGGVNGIIYAELLRMIHAQQPGNLEKAVMQIPYVLSCHQGSIDTFECSDALVVYDFEACVTELQSKGLTGIALLIDEADCLGKNVSLLQMFRNIFQIVEHCSLILAGTEAVFPALSEVFSPIPRQFHRLDVMPFAHWSETRDLVQKPIPKDMYDYIAPEPDTVRDLHELCGGAPDEVQLYCHHMYRRVEDGSSKRMALSPQVFREVLREYRSNTTPNVDTILNAIERLPDKILYGSKWVSRRHLTLEENIRVSVLRRELQNDKALSIDEKSKTTTSITEGYCKLFKEGIIESKDYIRLAGSPLTAGFWKSFVNVERCKRWSWNDNSFADNIHRSIVEAFAKSSASESHLFNIHGRDAVVALHSLRDGKTPPEFDEGMVEMIVSALFAHENKLTHITDITLQINSPAGKNMLQSRFFEQDGIRLVNEEFKEWIENHSDLLAGNDISVVVTGIDRWAPPTARELHRLGRISGYQIPDVFGPTQGEEAMAKFKAGDVPGCVDEFSKMLDDKDEAQVRNNLAFCQLLMGQVSPAYENVKKVVAMIYEPLYELNEGIAEFLQGNSGVAKELLRNALNQLRNQTSKTYAKDIFSVLILEPGKTKVLSYKDIPLDAAILLNLLRMEDLNRDDLENELIKLYPEKVQSWLATFTTN